MTIKRAPIYLPMGLSPCKRRQQRPKYEADDAKERDCANEMRAFHKDDWEAGLGAGAGLTVIETDFLSWLPNESLSVSVTV